MKRVRCGVTGSLALGVIVRLGKTFVQYALVSAVAATALVGAPTGAHAADPYCVYSQSGGAEACFYSYGEHFYVYDWAADGHSAVGELELKPNSTYNRFANVWVTTGKGSEVSKN
jgi:hypothetical protein